MQNNSLHSFAQGVLRGYSQIFFTDNIWLAIPLLVVSFIDLPSGLCGLLAIMVANSTALLIGFSPYQVKKGFYGFNSLLVGLGIGYGFAVTPQVLLLVVLASFLTLLLTIAIEGWLGKYYLPFLSLPFVFAMWIAILASQMLISLEISERGVYMLNDLFRIGGLNFVSLHEWWIANVASTYINSFFISLGAIFFQFNVFAGIVVALALLIYSRIAFTLSLLGYSVAYLAYALLGVELESIGYGFIGFNFILTSIAIGGYFYIASPKSYLWAIVIAPVIAFVTAGLFAMFSKLGLPIYSLPFNFVVLLFIYSFRLRTNSKKLSEVIVHHGSPEKNLYAFISHTNRFPFESYTPINLPFMGKWYVSQGYSGEHTHKGDWAYALDFIINDDEGKQYTNLGDKATDYYCFGKPVTAPADGFIAMLEDGIDDNAIGDINLNKNWGNTIVIKHSDYLFTKLSHLKKDSIKVKVGEFVRHGQVVALTGNSGRSPYPHLHFQVQAYPYIGSKTVKYPLANLIINGKRLESFAFPNQGDSLQSATPIVILQHGLHFIPGMRLKWTYKGVETIWEVFTTIHNQSYLYCHRTKSVAWFSISNSYFTFTGFKGSKNSLLYMFYQAAFRVPLAPVKDFYVDDELPINKVFSAKRLIVQDFIAPFYRYLKASYKGELEVIGSEINPLGVTYKSSINQLVFNRVKAKTSYTLSLSPNGKITLDDGSIETGLAVCEKLL